MSHPDEHVAHVQHALPAHIEVQGVALGGVPPHTQLLRSCGFVDLLGMELSVSYMSVELTDRMHERHASRMISTNACPPAGVF